jgi:lipoate-protein ligase A
LSHRRVVSRCETTAPPSLVLGSAQRDEVADAAVLRSLGVALVRRPSGGGAVVVEPGGQLWIEAWVPKGDPLWQDDVVAGAWWMGETWAAALRSLGLAAAVHRGRATTGGWSGLVCFAGLGPGEVTVAGRKAVGLSQRRVRAGVRLQCLVLARWDPARLLRLLAVDDDRRRRAVTETAGAAVGLDLLLPAVAGDAPRLEALASAFVAHLPGL